MAFLQRKIYSLLKKHLDKPEISLILGPRQAGKTTLMHKLQGELKQENKPTAYYNLDIKEDRQYFSTQHTLLDRIEKTLGQTSGTIFIDEIQRLKNAGLFLKGLYDLKKDHKYIVSGSGSLELKADIIEPMTGRKKIFLCLPLSFSEFAANKLNCSFSDIAGILDTNKQERKRLIAEYLSFGGYPRVVLSKKESEKREVLEEIFQSYLERDIQLILNIKDDLAFENLIKLLSHQTGSLINYNELSSLIGISHTTVKKYLNILEKTFVIKLLRPFYTNPRKELIKTPKVYFMDLGFLSLSQGKTPTVNQKITGSTFENACLLRLGEITNIKNIRFWRSSSGAEVDFVLRPFYGEKNIPVEVKLTRPAKGTLGKSYLSFLDRYTPKKGFFYTLQSTGLQKKGKTQINILPYHYLPKLS